MPGISGQSWISRPLRSAIGQTRLGGGRLRESSGASRPARRFTHGRSIGQLATLKETLYRTERAFRHEAGLPRREWFKHLVYAPGCPPGYGVKTLPGIREGIEQKQWDEARSFVPIVTSAVKTFTGDVAARPHS